MLKKYLKNKFTIIIPLLFLTDITILLDIPILRQVLGFLCFTLIPGFLIVHVLRLDELKTIEKFVLSVGLGVAFLMFTGLFINNVYHAFGYKTPLSTYSLMISFSIILFLLIFFAYKRNENNYAIPKLNLKNFTGKNMFLIPLTFPFFSIFGTYLMKTTNNNIAIIFTLLLISIYVILITILNKRVSSQVYPVAIWAISISLLFMYALRYNYLPAGSDVIIEYRTSLVSLKNLYWSISSVRTAVNSCLSIGILPTIYQSLLNIGLFNVYKIIFMILASFIPLNLYILFNKYINNISAFLSSLFFAFQYGFMYYITNIRTSIAILFFSFSLMILFSKINEIKKRILFIIFIVSVIVSHYSTTYITFIVISSLFLMTIVTKNIKKIEIKRGVTATMLILFFVLIFFWNSQVTVAPFTAGLKFFEETFRTMSEIFIIESREVGLQRAMGKGIQGIPETINLIVYYISFIFVGIGSIYSLIRYKNSEFDVEYLLLMFISLIILSLLILIPYVAAGYGITRTYQQMLVILAPTFVIGGNILIFKFLKSQYVMHIILGVLIAILITNVGGVYQIFGEPHSVIFNSKGYQYEISYIHEESAIAGNWLKDNMVKRAKICADVATGGSRGKLALQGIYASKVFFKHNKTYFEERLCDHAYIFLSYQNVVNKEVVVNFWKSEGWKRNIKEYLYLLNGKSKIYDNGGSEVWI